MGLLSTALVLGATASRPAAAEVAEPGGSAPATPAAPVPAETAPATPSAATPTAPRQAESAPASPAALPGDGTVLPDFVETAKAPGEPPEPDPPDPADELAEAALWLRVGALVTGISRDSVSCEGNDCPAVADGSDGFTHQRALVLGAGFAWQLHPLLRVGPGLLYTNRTELSYKDAPSSSSPINAGSLLSFDVAAELSPRLASGVWLVSGAKVGLSVLYPTGALERSLKRLADDCEAVGTVTGCESLQGARLGPNFGVGLGGLFTINAIVRLRAGALVEAYTVPLASIEAVDADASVDEDLYGGRFMLLGGVELGLQSSR